MFLLSGKDISENGFCWGKKDVVVDHGPRIRIPKEISIILEYHKVEILWLHKGLGGKSLVLCPEQLHNDYIKAISDLIPQNKYDEDYEIYITDTRACKFESQTRIAIGGFRFSNREDFIDESDSVMIYGRGLYYDIRKF